jgi:site-specific recombinase
MLSSFSSGQYWLEPLMNEELAENVMGSRCPVSSGTVFYAALTVVILWLESLIGGWLDNWFFHNRPGHTLINIPIPSML